MTQIALVTGASRGLGKNMALALAEAGKDVIITYLGNADMATATVAQIEAKGQKAAALQLDVSKAETYPAFFKHLSKTLAGFGADKLDYLVNNAGIGIHAPFTDTTLEQFDQMVNIHLKSAFFMTQSALPLLNDGGGVVNISTGLARFTLPGYDAYAAMKGGVEVLTRYQAKSLGEKSIRVNAVAPGAIETDFGGGAVRDNADLNTFVASQTALGRAGVPDDIGGVVAFLCSDAGRWVNGQRIEASGGMFL
jgi:NAD(P)-dependent dehydrogenase (short-subunit alcohol dehydrogenase family)